jgi:hypothetical protein
MAPTQGKELIGQVHYILQQASIPSTNSWVLLNIYDVDATKDSKFNMLILTPSTVKATTLAKLAVCLQYFINL